MYKLREELDLSKIKIDKYRKQINNEDQNEIILSISSFAFLFLLLTPSSNIY